MSASINVASHIPRMAAEQPHDMAVVCPSGATSAGRTRYIHLTYRELDTVSSQIASGLDRIGIGRGVRTVLMVRPGLELFSLVFGM